MGGTLQEGVPSSGLPIGVNTLVRPLHEAVSEDCRTSGVQYISNSDHRDGKSVKNSTGDFFSPENSTGNAYFATYFTVCQNSANSPELAQFF